MRPQVDFLSLYQAFDAPIVAADCGQFCVPHNPNGVPFCCDIQHAVPAVYRAEWKALKASTDLWRLWRGEGSAAEQAAALRADTPSNMTLLVCQGAARCQRPFRSLACRQFPFFPYLTEDYAFIGLAPDADFTTRCWVLQHPGAVTAAYRQEAVAVFDRLFSLWPDEMDSYADRSEELRQAFMARRRRIPLLHRSGLNYWLSPASGRLRRADFPNPL